MANRKEIVVLIVLILLIVVLVKIVEFFRVNVVTVGKKLGNYK